LAERPINWGQLSEYLIVNRLELAVSTGFNWALALNRVLRLVGPLSKALFALHKRRSKSSNQPDTKPQQGGPLLKQQALRGEENSFRSRFLHPVTLLQVHDLGQTIFTTMHRRGKVFHPRLQRSPLGLWSLSLRPAALGRRGIILQVYVQTRDVHLQQRVLHIK